jgi:peptidoglycan/LPS O-acetylase OafA/YrhL
LAGTTENRHYLALDAARGLAAIAVFLYHYKGQIQVFGIISGSFLAVDLFFLMSGLVIARAYERRLISGQIGFARFTAIRALRFWPLYLAGCAFGLVHFLGKITMGTTDAPQLGQVLWALPLTFLLLPTPGSKTWGFGAIPFSTSAWTLTIEFWFNLAYVLLLPWLSSRVLIGVALASFALLVWQVSLHESADLGWSLDTFLGGTARFWFSFSLGVLIHRGNLIAQASRVPGWVLFPVTFAFVILPANAIWWQLLWIAAIFPGFVILAARLPMGTFFSGLSDHLGRLSYAIYILHAPISVLILGLMKVWAPHLLRGHELLLAVILIPTVLILSALLTYRFDEPLRARLSLRGNAVVRGPTIGQPSHGVCPIDRGGPAR